MARVMLKMPDEFWAWSVVFKPAHASASRCDSRHFQMFRHRWRLHKTAVCHILNKQKNVDIF